MRLLVQALLFFLAFSLLVGQAAGQAPPKKSVVQSMRNVIGQAKLDLRGLEGDPVVIVSFLIKTVLSFLGVLFLLLIIYGGFLWMTAQGNDEQITKAKGIITSSAIGLVIIFSAYILTVLVISILQESIVTRRL